MRQFIPVMLGLGSLLLPCCAQRQIQKLPVPRAHEIQAIRLIAEGDQLLRDKKDHLAMLKYLEASQLNPYYEVIFNKLAVTYAKLHMLYQARQAVNRALALNRNYAFAYNTLGIINLAESRPKEAVGAFERAIRLSPGEPNFYLNYAAALVYFNRLTEAIEAYRQALRLDPDILQGSYVELTFPSEGTGDDPGRYFRHALVFAELGDLDQCLRYLEKAWSAGFTDFGRLREPAFQKFRDSEPFRRFLEERGIKL
jgi:tetratricopeptide (TPR) repeat protein